jgi:GT2 family glycosyltransferase
VTPQIRLYDGDAIWNCGGDLTWYGSRRYHFHGRPSAETPQSGWQPVTFITGCAALFPSSLFWRAGLLGEQFFFGEEDYELALRLRAQAIPLACCFDARVRHKVGRSITKSATARVARSSYVYYLSRSIDLRGHWHPLRWAVWRYLSLLYILPLLRLRHGVALSDLYRLARGLLRNGARLQGVDKQTFERAMQGYFE